MPLGPRKSGIPALVLIPAPLRTPIRRARRIASAQARAVSRPFPSMRIPSLADEGASGGGVRLFGASVFPKYTPSA